MNDRALHLVRALGLSPHPEGGHYREVFRSPHAIPRGEAGERAALTSIYFLLAEGEKSRWHRVAHDEVWHLHEGEALDLWRIDPDLGTLERCVLSRPGDPGEPIAIVPAGWWQAARPRRGHALAGCDVAPGFELADFELMVDHAGVAARLRERWPELADLL